MKEIFTLPVCELIYLGDEDVITASYDGNAIDADHAGEDLDLPTIG